MANSLRRNSFSAIPIVVSHCNRCQLDIESDAQSHGRTRILCPFCGEFLTGPNTPTIQQLKQDLEKRLKDNNVEENSSFRSRLGRTFNRVILRKSPILNNNGLSTSTSNLPSIGNKQQTNDHTDNTNSISLPPITTTTANKSVKVYDCDHFLLLINNETHDNEQIFAFFSMFYSNFPYMIQTLTTNDNSKQLNWKYLSIIHNYIKQNTDKISRLILKTIASCCIKEIRICDSTLKGYVILILSPVFDDTSNHHIFAHIIRRIAHFNDSEHQEIILVLKTLSVDLFRSIVHRLQTFVSINLFPSRIDSRASSLVNGWWIPSAIRTLALFNVTNEQFNRKLIDSNQFRIDLLDEIDLEFEYQIWLKKTKGFTFCQYPFVLSVNAKRTILKRDSEQQMIVTARKSMIQKFQNHQAPDLNMLFLNIYIRRAHLVSDSLAELTKRREDLKKKLRVTFVGEHGLDMGGLTKEWFLLLIREIFSPDYGKIEGLRLQTPMFCLFIAYKGMFVYYESSNLFWFNGISTDNNLREFNLVGILMGLAVYNAIILDIRFPLVCYKKLLTPAYLPEFMGNLSNVQIGIIKPTVTDFRTIRPDIAKNLQYLLDYEGNVQEDFGLTFEVSIRQYDTTFIYPLKDNGSNVDVTNENRFEYVNLLIDFYLNKHIRKQFEAFYYGFHSVCSSNALLLLLPEELEMLICGMKQCHLSQLAKITKYENCQANDLLIRWFWKIVEEMSSDKQRRLLLFVTGSDRMPIGGLNEMSFKITRMISKRSQTEYLLPMSHTCFNQLLLPPYSTYELLKKKLFLAIENCEGFGIE